MKIYSAVLLSLLLLLAACSHDHSPVSTPKLPNVVIVLVDELRWDSLGINGHPFFQSPCIDRIGREGATFDQAFVVTSLCSPSRATILTGLHTPQHGVRDIWTSLYPRAETIATRLSGIGYRTGFVGKSHLNSDGGPVAGFDRWFSFRGQGRYFDPELNVDGLLMRATGHMTDILTDEALRFMEDCDPKQPFLLILSHLGAHTPWTTQPRFEGLYANQSYPPPTSWDDDPSDQPQYLQCRQVAAYDEPRMLRYFDVLAGVEESTCRLIAALEDTGKLDDTVLIFMSDNGYLLGEHRMEDKRSAYDESTRIPILIRYPPRVPAGRRIQDAIALNLDIAPTVLAAAGLKIPSDLPGHSLFDLATGSASRDRFLYLYYQDICSRSELARCTPDIRGLRTLDHLYVEYPNGRRMIPELYDLETDPEQMTNLITDGGSRALVDSLSVALHELETAFAVH